MSKQSGIPPQYKHQKVSVEAFKNIPRGLDASDPGTGKTRVQIDLFSWRRSQGGKCALILAPKSLVTSAWWEDFRKYAPHIKVVTAFASNREKAFAQEADVYVTNVDGVNWLAKQPASFFKRFDTLIIDEMTAFKHSTSQRSRSLAKIKKHFHYRYGLTGTPNPNKLTDIWHQAFILDDGVRLGTSFYQFRAAVCEPMQVGPKANMVEWVERPGSELAVSSLLSDITVRHVFEECTDIPEHLLYSVPFYLTPKQQKAYSQMEKHALSILDSGKMVSAVNAAVVMGKLMQISSGAVYSDDPSMGNATYEVIDSSRVELLLELISERDKCVVFFNWKHQKEQIIDALKSANVSHCLIDGTVSDKRRAEVVRDFQGGFYEILLAHPQSAAHGLTLTKATSTIWVSPPVNLEHFLQGNRRIYRSGQTKKTETIVLVSPGTVEEKVYNRLLEKDLKQGKILELLRDYFNERGNS